MANLKIKNAPLIPNDQLESSIKIPTGGKGNYSVNLGQIAQFTKNSLSLAVQADVDRLFNEKADKSDTYTKLEVDERISLGQGGVYGFKTYTDFLLVKDNIPANSIVTILEEGQYQGDNVWDGQVLTPSPYDPLAQAKEYTDTKLLDKADKSSVYLKSETFNQQEVQDLVSSSQTSINNRIDTEIIQNGAALPFNETVNYVDGAIVVKDGHLQQLVGGAWVRILPDDVVTSIGGEVGDVSIEVVGNLLDTRGYDAQFVKDESGLSQQEINNKFKDRALNLDDFKTGANTDADAFYAMLSYAKSKGIKSLNITRDITLDRKITILQDATKWLDNINIDFHGHKVNWTGTGADNLAVGIIEVRGVATSTTTTVTTDYAEYTSELTVADASGFAVGDWILIDSTSTALPDIYLNILVRIEAINGNVIQTDTFRRLAVRPSVAAVNVTKMNVFDGFKITGNPLATAENQTSRANGIGFVQYQYGVNSHAYVKSEKLWFKTFRSSQCSRLTVIANGEKPAAVGGGEGYVVQLEYTMHSIVKATADKMRHCVDLTMAWHNHIVDSYDFESTSASYGCHAAFEYNNHFWRCKSVRSAQYGFQFAVITGVFGDTTDEHFLHDCEVVQSMRDCVNFANKGSGLYIYGGSFDAVAGQYSLTCSMSNVYSFDGAKFKNGVTVTRSANTNNSGEVVLTDSLCTVAPSTRSLRLIAGTTAKLVNTKLSGLMNIFAGSKLWMQGGELVLPNNTNGGAGIVEDSELILSGATKLTIPARVSGLPTLTHSFSSNKLVLDGVQVSQTDGVIIFQVSALDAVLKNCNGVARIIVNGKTGSSLKLLTCEFTAPESATVLTYTNHNGDVVMLNNTLKSVGNSLLIGTTNTLSKLQMVGNHITGVTSIPDAQATNAIVQGNIFVGATTLPTASATKFVANNIITA